MALIPIGVGLILASGCRTPAPPGQCKINVSIGARSQVNVDRDGNSLPIPVTFWQLKDIGPLDNASFEEIWERADEILAEVMVEKKNGKAVTRNLLPVRFVPFTRKK